MNAINKSLPNGVKALIRAGVHLRTKDEGDPFELLTKKFGDLTDVTLKRIGDTDSKLTEVSTQIDSIGRKMVLGMNRSGPSAEETWGQQFVSTKSADIEELSRSNTGAVKLDVKAITTGATSGGALDVPMRDTTSMLPRRRLMVRSLLQVIATESGTVEYAEQSTRTNASAMVAEAGLKPESNYEWELKNIPSRVVAHWVKASNQILSDHPQIQGMIDSELLYGLALTEETQLLFGNGTGVNLTGLTPNAEEFADPMSIGSPNMIDTIGAAILQVALADHLPDGIVMHPSDFMRIRLIKDGDGKYLLGDPQTVVTPSLFGLPIIATKAMTIDKFLVGSFSEAATLYDRMCRIPDGSMAVS